MNDELVGTIAPRVLPDETDGWILCDGIERDNIDNRYNNLASCNIGYITNNKYVPPNYSNMQLKDTASFDKNLCYDKHIKYKGHVHKFKNEKFEHRYDQIPVPLLLAKEAYHIFIQECFINKTENKIYWFVKY